MSAPLASLFLPVQQSARALWFDPTPFDPLVVDPHHEPIFAEVVMSLGYPRVGVLPPVPDGALVGRVLAADEPLPSRPVVWAQAAGRKRRRR